MKIFVAFCFLTAVAMNSQAQKDYKEATEIESDFQLEQDSSALNAPADEAEVGELSGYAQDIDASFSEFTDRILEKKKYVAARIKNALLFYSNWSKSTSAL